MAFPPPHYMAECLAHVQSYKFVFDKESFRHDSSNSIAHEEPNTGSTSSTPTTGFELWGAGYSQPSFTCTPDELRLHYHAREGSSSSSSSSSSSTFSIPLAPAVQPRPMRVDYTVDTVTVWLPLALPLPPGQVGQQALALRGAGGVQRQYIASSSPEHYQDITNLYCRECSCPIVTSLSRWLELPSEHWAELTELWVCHNETYSHLPLSGLRAPTHAALFNESVVQVSADSGVTGVLRTLLKGASVPKNGCGNGKAKNDDDNDDDDNDDDDDDDGQVWTLGCQRCTSTLGIMIDGDYVFARYALSSVPASQPPRNNIFANDTVVTQMASQLQQSMVVHSTYKFILADWDKALPLYLIRVLNATVLMRTNTFELVPFPQDTSGTLPPHIHTDIITSNLAHEFLPVLLVTFQAVTGGLDDPETRAWLGASDSDMIQVMQAEADAVALYLQYTHDHVLPTQRRFVEGMSAAVLPLISGLKPA